MIPTVEDILRDLAAGKISFEQAEAWMTQHFILCAEEASARPEARFWTSVKDAMPQSGEVVLVSGGTAMHVDGVWYTGMEEPLFRREIQWPVTHWRPLPVLGDE